MTDKPTLWWAYDTENRSISPLPAGPLLFPSLIIVSTVFILKGLIGIAQAPRASPAIINSSHYKKSKARYYYLIHKKIDNNGLEIHEEYELNQLEKMSTACGYNHYIH